MEFSGMNYISVVVGAILNMVLGFLWYGMIFSKPWAKLAGMTEEKLESAKARMGMTYSMTFVWALFSASVMQIVVRTFGIMTVQEAVLLAVILWLGLTGAAFFTNGAFEQRPLKLTLIDSGYFLVAMIMLSALFTFWV